MWKSEAEELEWYNAMKTQPVISGIEDGRQPHTINVGSIKKLGRSRKKKFLEPSERNSALMITWVLAQWDPFLTLEFQHYNTFVLFSATRFGVIYHNSNRKLTNSYFQFLKTLPYSWILPFIASYSHFMDNLFYL